jgi:hypothetical protein
MMDIHVQFAPLATLERMNDPTWNRAGRTLYDSGSLSFLPNKTGVPLLVDHEKSRHVGIVNRLYRSEEPSGPWLCATARVTSPPSWLTRDTPASFAFLPVQESSFTQPGDADHIRKGWIKEVSILSPGTNPAEPHAKVTVLLPAEQPKPATSTPAKPVVTNAPARAATAAPPTIHGTPRTQRHAIETAELRRRHDWLLDHGYPTSLEEVLDNLKSEVGYGRDMSREWRNHRTTA